VPGAEWPFLIVPDSGAPGGVSVDLLEGFATANGFSITYHSVTEDSKAMYPDSSYTACVRDVALHRLDCCVGFFWETPTRRSMVAFSPSYMPDIFYLVVFAEVPESIFHLLVKVFEPFSPELWLAVVTCCLIVGVVMWALGEVGDVNILKGSLMGLQQAMMKFLGQEGFRQSSTKGGKIIIFGFGFLCMLGGASYTASLSSFLLMSNLETGIKGIEDAIDQGVKICALEPLKLPLLVRYPALKGLVVAVDWFDTGVNLMDDGKCQAVILNENEYAMMRAGAGYYGKDVPGKGKEAHCNKVMVGDVVLTLALAMPLRTGLERAMGYMIAEAKTEGKLEELFKQYPLPETVCPHAVPFKDAADSLVPSDLSGVIVLAMGFVALGAVLHVVEQRAKKHAARHASRISRRVSQRFSGSSTSSQTPTVDTDDFPREWSTDFGEEPNIGQTHQTPRITCALMTI